MDISFYIIGLLLVALVVIFCMKNSFKSKCISLSMCALRETMHTFPSDSEEYFPPPPILKGILAAHFNTMNLKANLIHHYSFATPELAAYHLLDSVGSEFDKISRPDMASWCFNARDIYNKYAESALTKIISRTSEIEDGVSDMQRRDLSLNDIPNLGKHQKLQGRTIADDCYLNGLQEGQIIKLSAISNMIHENFDYMPNAVESGFLNRMNEYVESGTVVHFNVTGGEIVFVHRDYAEDFINKTISNH